MDLIIFSANVVSKAEVPHWKSPDLDSISQTQHPCCDGPKINMCNTFLGHFPTLVLLESLSCDHRSTSLSEGDPVLLHGKD